MLKNDLQLLRSMGHQCLSAAGPFGPVGINFSPALVLIGHQCLSAQRDLRRWKKANKVGHQCLSAAGPFGPPHMRRQSTSGKRWSPMPFGSGAFRPTSGMHKIARTVQRVTNAFRQRGLSAQNEGVLSIRWEKSHQCLSAAGPFGPSPSSWKGSGKSPAVTNAFRQRGLSAPRQAGEVG